MPFSRISGDLASLWLALGLLIAPSLPVQAQEASIEEIDEELIVIGSRLPTQQYKLGNVVTTLDEAAIDSVGVQFAADLFRFVPGVAVSRTGGFGGLAQLRLRGAEGNHVLVLVDGIDVSAAGSGEFDFSSLLSGDLQRIQVLRGPQSGLYGSNSLAGVISIETLDPEDGLSVSANFEGGANDVRQGMLSISGGSGPLRGRLSLLQRNSSFDLSEDNTLGEEDDDDENTTVSGKLSFIPSDAFRLDLVGRFNTRDTQTDGFDFSGGPLQGLAVDDASMAKTENLTLGVRGTFRALDGRSTSLVSVERTDSETDGGTFGSDSARTRLAVSTGMEWGDLGNATHRSTFFFEREQESFKNTVPFDPSQEPRQDRSLLGAGVEHRIDVGERFFLSGTVRHDWNDDFDDQLTWSTGASARILESGTRFHASYGVGVTNPTFFEQFGFTPGQFLGNPDLNPEKSQGWDFGIEQTLLNGDLVADITYFNADLEDEIQSVFLFEQGLSSVANDEGDSDRQGVEVSVAYQPRSGTLVRAAYTYTDATDAAGREVRRPEHTASLLVDQSFLDERFAIGASVVHNGDQLDTDFRNFFETFVAEATPVESYTLVNLHVRFQVIDSLQVYARVENLFDEDYEEIISYATPGAAVYAGFRYRFAGN
ncbi:MAG: TonB-dependent receptor [Pseudomonadota bacterium]